MENVADKLNITLPPDAKPGEPYIVVIRGGEAEKIKDNVAIFAKDVMIKAIPEYVKGNDFKPSPSENKGVVLFKKDPNDPYIHFFADPEHKEAAVLKAKLIPNPDLQAFGINEERNFGAKQMMHLFRQYAHLLENGAADAKIIIDKCKNFEATVSNDLKKADDGQGNKEDSVKQSITFESGRLPQLIKLKAPLYKGQPSVDIELEINVDAKNNAPVYSFYSLDYDSLMTTKATEYIEEVIDELKGQFVCMEQQ